MHKAKEYIKHLDPDAREEMLLEIPGRYGSILWLHYCTGLKLTEVADAMHYSYEWVRHMHQRALNKVYSLHKSEIEAWLKTRHKKPP